MHFEEAFLEFDQINHMTAIGIGWYVIKIWIIFDIYFYIMLAFSSRIWHSKLTLASKVSTKESIRSKNFTKTFRLKRPSNLTSWEMWATKGRTYRLLPDKTPTKALVKIFPVMSLALRKCIIPVLHSLFNFFAFWGSFFRIRSN